MNKLSAIMPIFAILVLGTPGFAQNQLSNNQPIRGDLHGREAEIQARLKADFKRGLIDATELAAFQRDLDGILVKENDFKSRSTGLTDSGRETLMKKLDVLEGRIVRHAAKGRAVPPTDPVSVH